MNLFSRCTEILLKGNLNYEYQYVHSCDMYFLDNFHLYVKRSN
uniref:Uncharacterized protein n=1 Tax=Bacillus pumilus TaxID=1408 RepID=A0A9Q9T5B0_BACPU|nr:hypothetical protein SBRMV_041 [Bacillus pumilus]